MLSPTLSRLVSNLISKLWSYGMGVRDGLINMQTAELPLAMGWDGWAVRSVFRFKVSFGIEGVPEFLKALVKTQPSFRFRSQSFTSNGDECLAAIASATRVIDKQMLYPQGPEMLQKKFQTCYLLSSYSHDRQGLVITGLVPVLLTSAWNYVCSFTQSLFITFIHLFIHSLIHLFTHSFIHSFIRPQFCTRRSLGISWASLNMTSHPKIISTWKKPVKSFRTRSLD